MSKWKIIDEFIVFCFTCAMRKPTANGCKHKNNNTQISRHTTIQTKTQKKSSHRTYNQHKNGITRHHGKFENMNMIRMLSTALIWASLLSLP